MGKQIAVVLYVVLMVATVVGADAAAMCTAANVTANSLCFGVQN